MPLQGLWSKHLWNVKSYFFRFLSDVFFFVSDKKREKFRMIDPRKTQNEMN